METKMTFSKWLDTFLSEKGIDLEKTLTVEGASGPNYMPVEIIVQAIKAASAAEQQQIKTMFVRIDFVNGDVLDFLKHLGKAIAI
jgi:hypothetical protein